MDIAYEKGRITRDQRDDYDRRCISVTLKVRPRVTNGQFWLPIRLDEMTSHTAARWRHEIVAVGVNDPQLLKQNNHSVHTLASQGWGSIEESARRINLNALDLQPGKHQLTLRVNTYSGRDRYGRHPAYPNANIPRPLLQSLLHGEFEVLPANQSSVVAERNPSLQKTVELSILTGMSSGYGFVECHNPPANLAFEVYCRTGTKEDWVDHISVTPLRPMYPVTLSWANLPKTSGERELILRPSLKAAASSTDIDRVWMGNDIVLKIPTTPPFRVKLPATSGTRRDVK